MDVSIEITRQLRILKKRLDEDAAEHDKKIMIIMEEFRRDIKILRDDVRELGRQLTQIKTTQT